MTQNHAFQVGYFPCIHRVHCNILLTFMENMFQNVFYMFQGFETYQRHYKNCMLIPIC